MAFSEAIKKANAALHDMVFEAEGPNDIMDAFCYVAGFTEGELKRRIALNDEHREEYEDELKSLLNLWEIYKPRA